MSARQSTDTSANTSTGSSTTPAGPAEAAATSRLSTLDRWLPAWIGLAMVAGLVLGRFIPGVSDLLASMEVGGISIPIALGRVAKGW